MVRSENYLLVSICCTREHLQPQKDTAALPRGAPSLAAEINPILNVPSLETFQGRLVRAWSNLVHWEVSPAHGIMLELDVL